MQPALGLKISFMRLFGSMVRTKIVRFASQPDTRLKTIPPREHSKKPSDVICARIALVLRIYETCRLAQIRPTVVAADAVDMVYLFFRPLACHIKPGEAMGGIAVFTNLNAHVAIFLKPPSNAANTNTPIRFHNPNEDACFWAIAQNFFELPLCNFHR